MSGTTQPETRGCPTNWWGEPISVRFARRRALPPLSTFLLALATLGVAARSAGAGVASATQDRIPLEWQRDVERSLRAGCPCDSARFEWEMGSALAQQITSWSGISAEAGRGVVSPERDATTHRVEVRGLAGRRETTAAVGLRVSCLRPAWRLQRALTAREPIALEDAVRLDACWVAPGVEPWEPTTDVLPGSAVVSRSLPDGAVLTPDDLKLPPLVVRGSWVTVLYHAPGLEVRARAQVRADGWLGDDVTLRLEHGKHDCRGRVIDRDLVAIDATATPDSRRNEIR